MSAESLSAIAGLLLSLVFSYVPGLAPRFDALDGTTKRLVMLLLLAAVSAAAFLLSCNGVLPLVTCDKPGALGLLQTFIAALVANQGTYLVSPARDALAAKLKGQG